MIEVDGRKRHTQLGLLSKTWWISHQSPEVIIRTTLAFHTQFIDLVAILLQKDTRKITVHGLGIIRDKLLYDSRGRQRKVLWPVPAGSRVTKVIVAPSKDNIDDDIDDELDIEEPGFVKNNKDVCDKPNQ